MYENITARSDKNFSSSTALSYIANKVRQGDRAGMTDIKEIEGTQVLELRQQIGGTDYVTWIYWLDGSIRELFTDTGSGLGLEDGLEILECEGQKDEQKKRVRFRTVFDGDAGSRRFFYCLCLHLCFRICRSRPVEPEGR